MAPFDANLSNALDRVYSAFSIYPEPTDLEGSPYKDVAGMFRLLKAAPLRELTGDQIGPYAGSAILTVGDVAEYKYYLPRIVEQAVLMAPHMGTTPPIIAERLKRAAWRNWPEGEQNALKTVFYAAWSWTVEQHLGSGADASGWLCAIATLEEPILPVLSEWSARPSVNALLQAAWLATMVKYLLSEEDDLPYFWSFVKPADRSLVANWVTSQERTAAFREGIGSVDQDDRWYIEEALDVASSGSRESPV